MFRNIAWIPQWLGVGVILWLLYHLPLQPQTVPLGFVIIMVQASSCLTSPLIVLLQFHAPASRLIPSATGLHKHVGCLASAPLDACIDGQPMTNCELVYWLSLTICAVSLSTFWSSYSLPAARIFKKKKKTDPADPAFFHGWGGWVDPHH